MKLVIRGMAFGSENFSGLDALLSQGIRADTSCPGQNSNLRKLIRQAAASAAVDDISTLDIYASQIPDGKALLKTMNLDQQLLGEFAPHPANLLTIFAQADHQLSENPTSKILLLAGDKSWNTAVILQSKHTQSPGIADISIFNPDQSEDKLHSKPALDTGIALIIPEHSPDTADEWKHFSQSIPEKYRQKSCAVHSLDTVVNDPCGLTSLVFGASAVQRGFIPRSHYLSNSESDKQRGEIPANLCFPERRVPWLSRGKDSLRHSLVAFQDSSNDWKFFQVLESPSRKLLPTLLPDQSGTRPVLIPFSGATAANILSKLDSLEKILGSGVPPSNAASTAYTEFSQSRPGLYHGCLIGGNVEQILKEIKLARIGIPDSFNTGKLWLTPGGSSFSTQPLQNSGVALMYPGAFNAYPGMGSELFLQFPILQEFVKTITGNLSRSMAEKWVYPRDVRSETHASKDDFYQHPIQLIEAGTTLSVIHTLLLREIFKIQPNRAFGYSLGEISMLWSNQVWKDGESSSREWQESPLFQHQIFGPMSAIRSHWSDRTLGDEFWGSYIIKGNLDQVQAAVDQFTDVEVTIINSPGETVIAGVDRSCKKIIELVGSHALPIPVRAAIHHPAIASTKSLLKSLVDRPVTRDGQIMFYSAAEYDVLEQSREKIAESISEMITRPLDFPRLVKRVYQDGARIFVETGPQKTCSRWVSKILKGKPHVTVPMNKKNQDDFLGLLKTLSLLVTHQVDLDLNPLYQIDNNRYTKQKEVLEFTGNQPQQQKQKKYFQDSRIPTEPMAKILEQEYARASQRQSRSQKTFLQYQKRLVKTHRKLLEPSFPGQEQLQDFETIPNLLFSRSEIETFTLGNPSACFDDLYAPFGSNRIPLLPNGPMQFLDRILSIDGELGSVAPGSSLVSEYSVPDSDWFNPRGQSLPLVALLEIGLQPCGFLSAFSGSIVDHPDTDYYFRNLDGEGVLLSDRNPCGKVIQTRVELLSSTSLQDTIIQQYSFELSLKGEPLFKGKSSFGYFPRHMLLQQSGLDGPTPVEPWIRQNAGGGRWTEKPNGKKCSSSQPSLPEIKSSWIDLNGGKHGLGYLFFGLDIPANAWYFDAHFHQDPVMPGSLGLEAMIQALQKTYPKNETQENQWGLAPNYPFQWKYRGQVTRESKHLEIEIHINRNDRSEKPGLISAEGSLWNSQTRIYEIKGLTLVNSLEQKEKHIQ
jgi:PfaB family protein